MNPIIDKILDTYYGDNLSDMVPPLDTFKEDISQLTLEELEELDLQIALKGDY